MPTTNEIEHAAQVLKRVREKGEAGDEVAALAYDAIGYCNLIYGEHIALKKEVENIKDLLFKVTDLVERMAALMCMEPIKMPECPDDLQGYG